MSSRVEHPAVRLLAATLAALLLVAPLVAISGVSSDVDAWADGRVEPRGDGRSDTRVEDRGDLRTEARLETAAQGEAARRGDAKGPARGYQLRCWQYGRLVFEENGVRLDPNDGARDASAAGGRQRLRVRDREGQPIIVTETANATCLLRAERADRGDPSRPR